MPIQTNRLRPWTAAPSDPVLGQSTHEFMRWLQASMNQLIGDPTPLPSPTVTTVGGNNSVQINWSEVGTIGQQFQVQSYQVFESPNAAQPGPSQVPIAVVPTNHGGTLNHFVRAGLTDTTTRYYTVRAVSPTGVLGSFSAAIPSKAATPAPIFTPTILAEFDKNLAAPVSVGASATTWLTQAVTMPSTGGPFRAFVSYGAIFDVSNSGIMTLWIEDGSNKFVTTQWLVNSANSVGPGGAGAAYSPVTYANGASVTFTAKAWSNASGSTNIITTPQGGSTQPSWMNIAIFASN